MLVRSRLVVRQLRATQMMIMGSSSTPVRHFALTKYHFDDEDWNRNEY